MAWTSRTDRFARGMIKSSSTPASIGPGAYMGHRAHEKEVAYAPFGSLQVQSSVQKDPGGAGPGSYDPKIPSAYDSGLPRREVPFGISAPQRGPLAPKVAGKRPGPGDYRVEKTVPVALASRTMGIPQSDKKTNFRSTSAPSIPMFHQSFGYEELGDGRLVRQGPRGGVSYLSGRATDSAGPGHYESASQMRSGGNTFGKSERSGPAPPKGQEEAPGPGHYISRSEARGHIVRAPAVVSSFVSQTQPSKRLEERPGPGQYQVSKVIQPSLREQHAELQYFGSTVERFKDLETSFEPGPGQYKEYGKRLRPAMKPFCASDTRFKKNEVECGPGPGAYAPENESLTNGPAGTVSILGAMGSMAFGSMEKKGAMAGVPKNAHLAPGPGHYYAAVADEVELDAKAGSRAPLRKRSVPTAAFKSNTNKNSGLPKAEGPPPGAYDPVHIQETSQVTRMSGKSEGFLSAATRLNLKDKMSAMPGPGHYGIPAAVTGGKQMDSFNRVLVEGVPQSGRPKSLGFAVSANRFQEGSHTKKKAPGPGQYDYGPGWITRTHNIYFGDLT